VAGESPAYITDYWGKAQPQTGPSSTMGAASVVGPAWHPLAFHGLDVAAAGLALLETRPALSAALGRASGLAEPVARRWLLYALALHDIGKFADCFQCKVDLLWHHKKTVTQPPRDDPGHGSIGITLWESGCQPFKSRGAHPFDRLFGGGEARPSRLGFEHWFTAVCGHHGRPVEGPDLGNRICDPARADARAYIEACAALFSPATSQEPRFRRSGSGS
jgi:CRISPR-associated endonuclease/helicase Cas3